MRAIKNCLVFLVALILLPAPSFAIDIPYKKPPFNALAWPVQVVWAVLMAPVECARGLGKTAHTLFPEVKPPALKMPKLQMPKLGMPQLPKLGLPKLPRGLADALGVEEEAEQTTTVDPAPLSQATRKGDKVVPPSAKADTN